MKEYIKHFRYMNKEERLYLMLMRDRNLKRGLTFTNHALSRMEERKISEKSLTHAIKNGQIVEYKKTMNDEVLTIRGCTLNKYKQQVYVILSIKTGKVITTYSNSHWVALNKSAELDKYSNNMEIYIPSFFKKQVALYY